ncbi:MAG: LPS-assembly protein LptD [Gammaproteobacteria bacterium]
MKDKVRFFKLAFCLIFLFYSFAKIYSEQQIQIKSIDATSISTLEDGSLLMEGSVKITTSEFTLRTVKAIYNREAGKLELEGSVELEGKKVNSKSSKLFLDLKNSHMKLEESNFSYFNQSFANAESITIKTGGETIITSSSWNNCSNQNPEWDLQIKEARLLEKEENVIVKGITLKIKNIPIFYFPYIRSAVGSERMSGFLAPSLKQGKDGLDLSIPYYFNLASNYDLELAPRYISDRGLGISSKARYLTKKSNGELGATLFNGDRLYSEETGDINNKRWDVSWFQRTKLNENISFNIDYEDTSDPYFYRDIGSDQYGSSKKNFLKKEALINWSNKNNKIDIKLRDYVHLNPFAPEEYKTQPRIDTYSYYGTHKLHGSLRTSLSEFELEDPKEEIRRYFIYPSLGFMRSWGSSSINFTAGNTLVKYKMGSESFTNSSPSSEIDYKIYLSKKNHSSTSFLIPNLKYIYQDGEINPLTPLIDTRERTLSYNNIFKRMMGTGLDRQMYSNKIIAGIKKLNMMENGSSSSFSIGQAFHIDEKREKEHRSNVVGEYLISLDKLNFSSSFELNNESSRLEKASISFGYRDGEDKKIELRGIYSRNVQSFGGLGSLVLDKKIKQAEFIMNWPIVESLNVFSRLHRDLESKNSLDLSYGVEYSNCCLKIGFMNRKWIEEDYFSWMQGYNSPAEALSMGYLPSKERDNLFIFFEFKNLGRLGRKVDKIISSPLLD